MNNQLANVSIRISNSTDFQSSLFSMNLTFLDLVLREQQRVKLWVAKDETDNQYQYLMFASSVDSCKINSGAMTSIFARIVYENVKNFINVDFSCPYRTNFTYTLTDCPITDTHLPPMVTEKRFKFQNDVVGIISGEKGWKKLYFYEVYGSLQKP